MIKVQEDKMDPNIFILAIHIVHLKVKITVIEYTKMSKTNKSVTYEMIYLKYRE